MKKPKIKLEEIAVLKIEPNPHNPRGKDFVDIDENFAYLKRSIKEFGLLVPLVVFENKGKFKLIDGERRYRALKELGIKDAPAHVITGGMNTSDSRNLMFHIHTNREQWDACQQCRALEPLYKKLKEKFHNNEKQIASELIRLTGTHPRTIGDRLNFLRWPEKIKNMVYEEKSDLYWTIVEIEKGIIIPAEQNFPAYFKKVGKDEIRKLLLDKYLGKFVYKSTEARQVDFITKVSTDNKEMHEYASIIFARLVENISYSFQDAREEFLTKYPEAEIAGQQISLEKLVRQLVKIATTLKKYNIKYLDNITKKQKAKFKEALEDLKKSLDRFISGFRQGD